MGEGLVHTREFGDAGKDTRNKAFVVLGLGHRHAGGLLLHDGCHIACVTGSCCFLDQAAIKWERDSDQDAHVSEGNGLCSPTILVTRRVEVLK